MGNVKNMEEVKVNSLRPYERNAKLHPLEGRRRDHSMVNIATPGEKIHDITISSRIDKTT